MPKHVRIAELKPTQMTLGMYFVSLNLDGFQELSKKRFKKLVERKVVPAVRGPDKHYWMIDRHHFCRSLYERGETSANVKKVLDCSHLGEKEFAHVMEKSGLIHPYNEAGDRLGFSDLPTKISELTDDPYRTLAGLVREHGGYRKEKRPYAEFLWADFYRERVDRHLLTGNFSDAVQLAVDLAGSNEASHLPGWK
ncbi:MAG: ParB-like protein [Rhizobiaceae bacterium]